MASKYRKKCSKSLAIKEMKIKMTLRFHSLQSQWLLSTTQSAINAGKDVGEKEPLHC
jgi:hypothetical protein